MIVLRPYQSSLLDRASKAMGAGYRAPLLVAPCGAGKTVMFSYMAMKASENGRRVYIIAHRDELVQQISDTLTAFGVKHSFIAAGRHYDSGCLVQVCSVMSLARRLGKVPTPDLIIADEAHHATAGSWRKVAKAYPRARFVGVTASPERLDGTGLGDVFDEIIVGPSVRELIDLGALCDYRLYVPSTVDLTGVHVRGGDYDKGELAKAVDKPSITGDAVTHYRRLADGRRAIAFCTSVEHAKHVALQFQGAGYQASWLDGGMAPDLRKDTVAKFRAGKIQVLTSCDLVSEGFDLPAIEVAIMLRPTQSLALWIQQSGRALRPFPGKDHAILLDHAGNAVKHGLPDDDREWSLEGRKAKKRTGFIGPVIRVCPKCFAAMMASAKTCRWCGYAFQVEARAVEEKEGELVEVDTAKLKKDFLRRRAQADTLEKLIEFAKGEGYKHPVAWAARWQSIREKYVGPRRTTA